MSSSLEGAGVNPTQTTLCRTDDKAGTPYLSLPRQARQPLNRCNLPADILGGLTFQKSPAPLYLDGLADLHRPLFEMLDEIPAAAERAARFIGYMEAHFSLLDPAAAGLVPGAALKRAKASYRKVVMGWAFDADGREAAILKAWVESRFGLCPRYHGGQLRGPGDAGYGRYLEMASRGLYATNALESQLDLLFTYCQYELARQYPQRSHLRLYRGVNRLSDHEVMADNGQGDYVVLLNSVNSFSRSRERAGEFGDTILAADVPLTKLALYSSLLPGLLKGEDEYVVLGGLYRVRATHL